MPETEKYDGFTIVPDGNFDVSQIVFFELDDESKKGTPIENTELGDMYHVIMYRVNKEQTDIEFDDTFEAIFIDPLVYAKSLLPNFYCTIIRKTDKSVKWIEEFLTDMFNRIIISKLKNYKEALESISQN